MRVGLIGLAAATLMLPGLAGAATVIAYVSGWIDNGTVAFGIGSAIGLAATALLSLSCRRYAFADRANPAVYSQLTALASGLRSRLPAPAPTGTGVAAAAEATAHLDHVVKELGRPGDPSVPPGVGLRWLLASGYTGLWRRLHRAEEALVAAAEGSGAVVRQALHDELCLEGSKMPNRDELLDRLRRAVADLSPTAARYLVRAPRETKEPKPDPDSSPKPAAAETTPGGGEDAVAVLCSTHNAINEYRDDARDGIVHARNRLFAATLFTGITTFGLLGLALACGATTTEVCAGAAFFLVGGVIGLFRQLRTAANAKAISEEDYSLSVVRLIHTPLFSGLAAVGGVVITAMLLDVIPTFQTVTPATPTQTDQAVTTTAETTTTPQEPTATEPAATAPAATTTVEDGGEEAPPAATDQDSAQTGEAQAEEQGQVPGLSEIFDLSENPIGLVIAAIFGLTPSLLITRLQAQTEQYKQSLQDTEAAQRAPPSGD